MAQNLKLTRLAKMRVLTFLSLGAIVVPVIAGWSGATSITQRYGHTLTLSLPKSHTWSVAASRGALKAAPLTAQEVEARGLPASGVYAAGGQVPVQVQQAQAFANPAFQKTWERTDKPVASGATQRSWYWGPAPLSGGLQEDYAEGAGGKRLVQYFDKSRMEINNPGGDPSSKFYVTNGLLTVELISGKMQTGNNTYADRYPADIPMASDADDASAPTYYSFQGVSNTTLGDHPANSKVGQPATATIKRDGTVGDDATKSAYPKTNYVYYDQGTKHNVPQAIWDFLNDSGPVYDSATGQTATARLSDPWFYATGLPISEPYWARVKIAGQQQDVLIQAFERRVVTYAPNGVPGYKVQMGNIGQHYYDWRYKNAGQPQTPIATATAIATAIPGGPAATPTTPGTGAATATPTRVAAPPTPAAPDCSDVPAAKSGSVKPLCGPVGTVFNIHIMGFQPGEKLSYWFTLPDGEIDGTDAPIDIGNHPGYLDLPFDSSALEGIPGLDGIWSITFEGQASKHQSQAFFKITPNAPQPGQTPTAAPTTDPNASNCNDVPASINMTVSPSNCAKAGTRFTYVGRGFQAGENVGVYVTGPDQAVFGAPFQITADGSGVAGGVSFTTDRTFPLGVWAMTMEGTTTHARAIGYFKLTPP